MNKKAMKSIREMREHRTSPNKDEPEFCDGAIRIFQDMLYRSLEADEKKRKQNIQWTE